MPSGSRAPVAGQGDLVDLAGAEAAAQEGRHGRGFRQFVVADDVGGDVADPPVGAQGRGVPLGRGEFAEQRQQVGALLLGERHQVGLAHEASSSSRVRASYLPR